MITHLDMAIPAYVAGAAILLVAALVFRLRKVGRQDLTSVGGNLSDFDFRAVS
jgi:methylmalonyl-CoA mutase cobalamin-binding subunit